MPAPALLAARDRHQPPSVLHCVETHETSSETPSNPSSPVVPVQGPFAPPSRLHRRHGGSKTVGIRRHPRVTAVIRRTASDVRRADQTGAGYAGERTWKIPICRWIPASRKCQPKSLPPVLATLISSFCAPGLCCRCCRSRRCVKLASRVRPSPPPACPSISRAVGTHVGVVLNWRRNQSIYLSIARHRRYLHDPGKDCRRKRAVDARFSGHRDPLQRILPDSQTV